MSRAGAIRRGTGAIDIGGTDSSFKKISCTESQGEGTQGYDSSPPTDAGSNSSTPSPLDLGEISPQPLFSEVRRFDFQDPGENGNEAQKKLFLRSCVLRIEEKYC